MSRGYEEAYRMVGLDPEANGHDSLNTINTIPKDLPTAAPFPVGALPLSCRRLVKEAAAAIGCPPDRVAVPMLVALGTAIGNSRVLKLKSGWEEGAALYGAAIADPGEKKTPAQKVAVEPAIKMQAELRENYRREVDDYKREQREYDVDKRDAAKTGEPAPPEPDEPIMERTVVEDVTVERLADLLGEAPRGLLQQRDELAGWVKAMDQYKQGGKGAERQFWLSAWSNGYVSVDRKGRPEPLMVQRPFVGVFGAIQPTVLPELGANRDDGMLDRFLFAYPDPVPSRWTDDAISGEARDNYAQLYRRLRDLHMPLGEYGDPEPVRVHLSGDAKAVLVDVINAHREEMEWPGFPARLKGPWSKLEAYLARLTLIVATARAAHEGAPERGESRDVLAAMALLDYFKNHARRVCAKLHGENPDERLAEDVARFLAVHNRCWKGHPAELHEQLDSDYKPSRPDELTKRLKVIANRYPSMGFESKNGWVKDLGNQRRFVELTLENGANGVKGVKSGQ
jgi:hypothetical protein